MIRLILFGLVCVFAALSLAFGTQSITLKKLYDPLEDFQTEFQDITKNPNGSSPPKPQLSSAEQKAVKNQVEPALIAYLKRSRLWTKICTVGGDGGIAYQGVHIHTVNLGSFTRPNSKQKIYTFTACEPIESYGCVKSGFGGSLILEQEVFVAMYTDEDCIGRRYTVKDVNQNGLSELMLVVPFDPIPGTIAVRLLEFPGAKVRNLGDIPTGADPAPDLFSNETCTGNVVFNKTTRTFSSNIIYVLKSSTPQFFSEKYEVNCDYRDVGVKARKVRDLKPIKPVLRPSGFTRIF